VSIQVMVCVWVSQASISFRICRVMKCYDRLRTCIDFSEEPKLLKVRIIYTIPDMGFFSGQVYLKL